MWTNGRWTLDELVDQVAVALASGSGYGGQASGRVRDLPDRRAVRYYTTLGLVDRPSGWRGRVALYGDRHLLQLTAIKRLQAQGLTLAQVQGELTAVDDAALRRLAGVGPGMPEPAIGDAAGAPPPPVPPPTGTAPALVDGTAAERAGGPTGSATKARRRFWTAPHDTTTRAEPAAEPATEPAAEPRDGGATELGHDPGAELLDGASLRGVRLAPGVILLVEGGRPLGARDLAAVRAAARPLLATVQRLGLDRRPEPAATALDADGTADGPAPAPDSRDSREGDER